MRGYNERVYCGGRGIGREWHKSWVTTIDVMMMMYESEISLFLSKSESKSNNSTDSTSEIAASFFSSRFISFSMYS
jgi:hypothetical protein